MNALRRYLGQIALHIFVRLWPACDVEVFHATEDVCLACIRAVREDR